jgi:hypothetical protein
MYKCPICNKSYETATDMAQCATKCAQRIEKEANERKLEQLDRDLTNAIDKVREAVDAYNAISTEYHYDFTIHKNKLLVLTEGSSLEDKRPVNFNALKLHGKPVDIDSVEQKLSNFCDNDNELYEAIKAKNDLIKFVQEKAADETDEYSKTKLREIVTEINEKFDECDTPKEKKEFIKAVEALLKWTFSTLALMGGAELKDFLK